MADAADLLDKYTRLEGLNDRTYKPQDEPLGMDGDGHRINLLRMARDMSAVGKEIRALANIAAAAASQQDSWKLLENAEVARLSDNTIAIVGDHRVLLVPRRAVRPTLTGAEHGWIKSVSYDAPTDRTTLTIEGFVVPAMGTLYFGQDPATAPQAPDVPLNIGQALYFANTFMTP